MSFNFMTLRVGTIAVLAEAPMKMFDIFLCIPPNELNLCIFY